MKGGQEPNVNREELEEAAVYELMFNPIIQK